MWQKFWPVSIKTDLLIENSINKLLEVNHPNTKEILYILTYGLSGNMIMINSQYTDIFDQILSDSNYPIEDINVFINELGKLSVANRMKEEYFKHLKIISLYDLFVNQLNIK